MINTLYLLVTILLTISGASYSSESIVNKGDTTLFLGTIGPLFVVQHGLNIQLSHQFNKTWSLDAEGGEYNTNSTSPIINTAYASLGLSLFIQDLAPIRDYVNFGAPVFIKTSYSYHDDKKMITHNGKILGRNISTGIELSPGLRVTHEWYSLELIPISLYLPIDKKNSGEEVSKNLLDRILNLKIGLTF